MSFLLLLRKLVKILRADTAPHQIGLAVALGILAGLPSVGFATLIVVLAFLVLNANLGAFLLALGGARAFGAIASAPLASLGEALLEAQGLRPLWITVLNLPVLSVCGLDRYERLGAFVVALPLAVLAFAGARVAVAPARRAISRRVERSERLRAFLDKGVVGFALRILFGKQKRKLAEIEGGGWIRKGFLIPFALTLAGAFVFWHFAGGEITRRGIELAASASTGKEVRVRGASLSFLAGALDLRALDVLRPRTEEDRIAEGRKIVVDLSPLSMLDRRFVVEEVAVENLTWHLSRERGAQEPPPPAPPESPSGKGTGLVDVLDWIHAHEEQVRWAIDRLDDYLRPDPGAERARVPGRARWIYAARERPLLVSREAAVRNLVLERDDDQRGLFPALERLDLALTGLSSNPVTHGEPIRFEATGAYGTGRLSLSGVLDVRKSSESGHDLGIALASDTFGAAPALGIGPGSGLELAIDLGFDPRSSALSEVRAEGSFDAANPARVRFAFAGVGARTFDVTLEGLDLGRADAFLRPEAIGLRAGTLDIVARVGVDGAALDGGFAVSATGLELAPGARDELAGLPAAQLCRGLNALARQQPIELGFLLSGTTASPGVRLDETGLANLLAQVRAGLLLEGEERLAREIERRLGPLSDRIDEELGERLSDVLPGGFGDVLPGGAPKKAGEAVERAGSVLEGILGGKKRDRSEERDKKPGDG